MPSYEKISDLTAGSALDGTELFEAVQSSNSTQVTGAQVNTYVHANPPAGVTATSVITGEYVFDEDSELDYSGSLTDGQASATTTITELPTTTTAILSYIEIADTSADVRIAFKRSSGGTQEYEIYGSFADVGTNRLYGFWWMPTENNTVYITNVQADSVSNWLIVAYKTGS